MRDQLAAIDDAILKHVFQPMADRLTGLFKVNNYVLSLAFANLAILYSVPQIAWLLRAEVDTRWAQEFAIKPAYAINMLLPVVILVMMRRKVVAEVRGYIRSLNTKRVATKQRRFATRSERLEIFLGLTIPLTIYAYVAPLWVLSLGLGSLSSAMMALYFSVAKPQINLDGRHDRAFRMLFL